MLELKNITKSYKTGNFKQVALKNVQLKFRSHEFVAILGPSGSGKTTLLNIIGGLDHYDTGDLLIHNKSTKKFKTCDWDSYRNHCIGFIFQSYHLIHHISILNNVEMGLALRGISFKKRRHVAKEMLEKVGLKEHIHKKPKELSGGQMQRVAIARALVCNPDIILADEPTGALDTTTSIQIMNLIKEIAKDKLVIMVTHNKELAQNYATRVIRMCDGKIISDSNPVLELEEEPKKDKFKKTSMNFLSALYLSFHNIRTKKGRTFAISFASSIGIIGIALILSLSNGFNRQLKVLEQNTMAAMPIVIQNQIEARSSQEETTQEFEEYPTIDYAIKKEKPKEVIKEQNHINKEFLTYLEKINPTIISGISYSYYTRLNVINKIDDKVIPIDASILESFPKSLKEENEGFLSEKYDILAGRMAKVKDELLLVVDSKNQVQEDIIHALGLGSEETISFEHILESTLKLVFNDQYYQKDGDFYRINPNLDSLYDNKDTLTLKVVGIIRLKEEYKDYVDTAGLYYMNDLPFYIMLKNKDSAIVKDQQNKEYNVLTGETYNIANEEGQILKKQTLAFLGDESIPHTIQIYPKDFTSKEKIVNYLDRYNDGKKSENQIIYKDEAKALSSVLQNIMNAITIVLVAFSAISLFVSSIMISIIMYISVLERTNEIGILKSLGARKKDIARVFNAEAFLIGFSSGILGILITKLLLIPINSIFYHLTKLKNIALLNPLHALILILSSVGLTLIGGMIPAKLASKKDPVEALR